jgi:hypothetical protein
MTRLFATAILCVFSAVVAKAWVPSRSVVRRPATSLRMAIDYNDPVVAEEFTKVQPMQFEDVEAELSEKGITVPPTMK